MSKDPTDQTADENAVAQLVCRHLRCGWWSLLVFLSLGIVLEALHACKVGWYLDPAYETRRLMWTLAHAHGTLLALVHVAFGATLHVVLQSVGLGTRFGSACLCGAGLLVPGGFFLGGIYTYGGDPGLGIYLLPVGALLLFLGVLLAACSVPTRRKVP